MTVQKMYNEFRSKFPEITEKADAEHIRIWGEIAPEFAYSWFESLAKALNQEMANETPITVYQPVYEYFRRKFLMGDDEERNCIDVAFVENLFWQILPQKAEPYWRAFPDLLKELYIKFHHHAPPNPPVSGATND